MSYGEEKFAWKIANAIVDSRDTSPLSRTSQLAALIAATVPKSFKEKKHPATRSFQAIRIYINSELEQVKTALDAALLALKPGGRLAVIKLPFTGRSVGETIYAPAQQTTSCAQGLAADGSAIKKDICR